MSLLLNDARFLVELLELAENEPPEGEDLARLVRALHRVKKGIERSAGRAAMHFDFDEFKCTRPGSHPVN